jgi:hypothetical protein
MFLGLPDPDLLGQGKDPDPDPSIIKQSCIVTSLRLFIFENDVNVASNSNRQKT